MKPGEKFSVVVKLTTPGSNYPVAIEYPYPGFSSAAIARSGESYVSSNGVSWTDLTTEYPNSNVCLKAFSSRPGQTNQVQQTPTPAPTPSPTPASSGLDRVPPTVLVSSPGSYSTVYPGQNLAISWSASDNKGVASVALRYSVNGGSTWTSLTDNQPKSGTYTWKVPEISATTLSLEVTACDSSGNTGSKTVTCFVRKNTGGINGLPNPTPTPAPTPPEVSADGVSPTVIVSAPASYTMVFPGQVLTIAWIASDNQGVASVAIQYSLNGGSTWMSVADNQPKSGSYSWRIPENTAASTVSLNITARDSSGNTGSQTRVIFIKPAIGSGIVPTPVNHQTSIPSGSYSNQKESCMADLVRETASTGNRYLFL